MCIRVWGGGGGGGTGDQNLSYRLYNICPSCFWVPVGPPVIQDGVPSSYMLAVFKLVVHEESEMRTSLSHGFTKGGLMQLQG